MKMNKIVDEWYQYTFNPITGCLSDECPYCFVRAATKRFSGDPRLNKTTTEYTREKNGNYDLYILDKPIKIRKGRTNPFPFGFEPTFHRYRFKQLKTVVQGTTILICNFGDMFGPWVPDEWIERVFAECEVYPQHHFMFLTSYPARYKDLLDKGILRKNKNFWYGSTVTHNTSDVFKSQEVNTFIAIEPILEEINPTIIDDFDWVIVGAENSKREDKVIPKKEWIEKIVTHAKEIKKPIYLKSGLKALYGKEKLSKQIPKPLKEKRIVGKKRELLYTNCAYCKKELQKQDMFAILSREKRGASAKAVGYVCKKCYKNFMKVFINEVDE